MLTVGIKTHIKSSNFKNILPDFLEIYMVHCWHTQRQFRRDNKVVLFSYACSHKKITNIWMQKKLLGAQNNSTISLPAYGIKEIKLELRKVAI